jgi:hypothetical protein
MVINMLNKSRSSSSTSRHFPELSSEMVINMLNQSRSGTQSLSQDASSYTSRHFLETGQMLPAILPGKKRKVITKSDMKMSAKRQGKLPEVRRGANTRKVKQLKYISDDSSEEDDEFDLN